MNRQLIKRRHFLKLSTAAAVTPGILNQFATTANAAAKRKLLKGVIINMLPKNLSDKEKFQVAKRSGFEWIEARTFGNLDAAKEQSKLAREAGVPIHSVLHGWWPPFTDTTPSVVQKSIDAMAHALRCAQAMGASAVLLVPTRVTENFRYADAYKRSQDYVRKLIPVAKETGVVIAIENVWSKFLLSPLEFARYIDECESPLVRAYFDVGNVIIYGFSQDWIRTLGKRIVKIHLKDFQRKGYQWKNLLEGDVNWPEVRKALDEINYNGYLTAELGAGTEEKLTDIAQRMDKIIAAKF